MKKLISIVLSLMLIMTSLPMIASADGESELQTVDIKVADSVSLNTVTGEVRTVADDGVSYYIPTDDGEPAGYVVYRFNLPMGAVGVEIESATLSYYECYDYVSTDSFFRVPYGTWTNKNDVTQDYISAVDSQNSSDNYVVTIDVGTMTSARENKQYTVDVTKAVQAAVADGEAKLALTWNWASTWYGVAREVFTENHASQYPVLTVSYRQVGVPAMAFQKVSINNGDTISINEGVSFTYSNPVDPSSVTPSDFVVKNFADETISISSDDIVVSGKNVTLKKTWDSYSAYTVSLSGVTDTTGQTVVGSNSISFKTSADNSNAEVMNVQIKDTQWWTSSHLGGSAYHEGAAQNSGNYIFPKDINDNSQNGYTVYRFELPQAPAGKVVDSAKISYWHNYDYIGTDKWFVVPFGTWTAPLTDWNDPVAQAYRAEVDSAASQYKYIGTYSYNLNSWTDDNGIVNVTSAIKDSVAEGESNIAFSFHGGDHNDKTYMRYLYHELNSGKEPVLTINWVAPEFASISSNPEKGGKLEGVYAPVEMTLATTLAGGYENYVSLIDASNGTSVDADVSFDETTNVLTVTPDGDLKERGFYKVVLKAGLTDIYGNSLSADRVIHAFSAGVGMQYSSIKFTSEITPVYDSCTTIGSYTAGASVTAVAKIENLNSKPCDAVMIIALYGADDELIDLDVYGGVSSVPASEEVQFSKEITVPANVTGTAIKAFIWDGFDYIRPVLEHASINQAQ